MPRAGFVNIREKCACFLSFVSALNASIEITYHEIHVNYHCMLFGKIAEKDKIFTEGVIPLCFAYLFTQYGLVLFGMYLCHQSIKYPRFNWTHSRFLRKMWKGLLLYLVCLHLLFLKGFHSLCGSLDAPVCSSDSISHIEFKYFKPKYFDGEHFFNEYLKMLISSLLNLLCLVYFYRSNIRRAYSTTIS